MAYSETGWSSRGGGENWSPSILLESHCIYICDIFLQNLIVNTFLSQSFWGILFFRVNDCMNYLLSSLEFFLTTYCSSIQLFSRSKIIFSLTVFAYRVLLCSVTTYYGYSQRWTKSSKVMILKTKSLRKNWLWFFLKWFSQNSINFLLSHQVIKM